MSAPLFSVIIATYNAGATIGACLKRLEEQSFRDFELIVLDGGSKDNTVKLIQESSAVSYFRSERDNGIYDAWNKGLKVAKGEWVLFIGADDYLLPDALAAYADFVRHLDDSVYYVSSKVQIISKQGDKRRVFGWPWTWKDFRKAHIVAHPASLHRRSLFQKYGVYNTDFKIAGDYELLLRPGKALTAAFLDRITLEMTEGGVSNGLAMCAETRKAQLINRVNSRFAITLGYLIQLNKLAVKQLALKMGLNMYLRREFRK